MKNYFSTVCFIFSFFAVATAQDTPTDVMLMQEIDLLTNPNVKIITTKAKRRSYYTTPNNIKKYVTQLQNDVFEVSRTFNNTEKNRFSNPWLAFRAAVAYRMANPTKRSHITILDGKYSFGTSEKSDIGLDWVITAQDALKEYQPDKPAIHSPNSADLAFNGVDLHFSEGTSISFFSNQQIGAYGVFTTPALFSVPSNWMQNGEFNPNRVNDTFNITGSLSFSNMISNTESAAQNSMSLYNVKADSAYVNMEFQDIETNNMYGGWNNGGGTVIFKGEIKYGIGFHHFAESQRNVVFGMENALPMARRFQKTSFKKNYRTGENISAKFVSTTSGVGLKRCSQNIAYESDKSIEIIHEGDYEGDQVGKGVTVLNLRRVDLIMKFRRIKSTRPASGYAVDNESQWGAIPFIRISDYIEDSNITIDFDSYEGTQSLLAISSLHFVNSTITVTSRGEVLKKWQFGAPSDSLSVNRSPLIAVYNLYGNVGSSINIQGDFRSDSTEIVSLKGVKSGVKFTVNNSTLTNASPTKPLIKIEAGGQTEADSVLRMTATTLITPSSSSLLMSSGGGKDTYVHVNSVVATAPFWGLYQYTKLIFSEQPKRLSNFDPSQNNVVTPPIMSIDTVVAPQIGNIDLGGLVNLRVFRTINADRNIYTDNLLENVEYAVLQQVNINGRGTFYATKGNNTVKYFFRTAAQSGLTPVYEPYFYGNKAGVYKFVRRGNIVYVTEPN